MTNTLIEQKDELATYKGKWKNLYIFKTRINNGNYKYESEEQAAKEGWGYVEEFGGDFTTDGVQPCGTLNPWPEFVTVIQLPVGD